MIVWGRSEAAFEKKKERVCFARLLIFAIFASII